MLYSTWNANKTSTLHKFSGFWGVEEWLRGRVITQPGWQPQSNVTRQANRDTHAHKTHLLTRSQGCWAKCLCDSGSGTIVVLSTAKTSEKAGCKPHTTVTGCWWHPEGPPWGFHIRTTLQPLNHDISAAMQGCQETKPAANRLGYGAKHQTCTPCAVTAHNCRMAGTISYSHCWIILLSETTVCFWGLQKVPESHGSLNSLSCSTPLSCAEYNPLA